MVGGEIADLLLVADIALAVRHGLDIRVFAFVFSMAHDALGGLRLGREGRVVAKPRVAAESMAVNALPGHVFFVERSQEPVASIFVMRRVTGYAARRRSKIRVSTCQLAGLNDRIARFAATAHRQHQRDNSHHQRKGAHGQYAAQASQRAFGLTWRMLVPAGAVGTGAILARAAGNGRAPAFPTITDLGRVAFAHAAAASAGARAEFAWLAPCGGASATEFLRRPLVAAGIVFKFFWIHHIAYTFTTITCQNISPSTAAASGRWNSNQYFIVLWQA